MTPDIALPFYVFFSEVMDIFKTQMLLLIDIGNQYLDNSLTVPKHCVIKYQEITYSKLVRRTLIHDILI